MLVSFHTIDMMLSRPTEPNRTRYIDSMVMTQRGHELIIQDTIYKNERVEHIDPTFGRPIKY